MFWSHNNWSCKQMMLLLQLCNGNIYVSVCVIYHTELHQHTHTLPVTSSGMLFDAKTRDLDAAQVRALLWDDIISLGVAYKLVGLHGPQVVRMLKWTVCYGCCWTRPNETAQQGALSHVSTTFRAQSCWCWIAIDNPHSQCPRPRQRAEKSHHGLNNKYIFVFIFVCLYICVSWRRRKEDEKCLQTQQREKHVSSGV